MKTKPTLEDVEFSKHYDYHMGHERPFWRADYDGYTIATLCRTKAECVKEARTKIKKMQNDRQK